MFKNLLRALGFLIILIALLISYLSFFGVKTDKFNELIRSKVSNLDKRLDLELQHVFFKINLKERSFSLNSKDIKLFIINESQEFENVDIFIGLESLINKDYKIRKIIINSKENKISNLLKFIRKYKINIPVLYLENSVKNGNIIYDLIINTKSKNLDEIKIVGKIIDADLNILGKEKLENINLDFNYRNENLEINNLNLSYKSINFLSKNIIANIDKNLINIKGDFRNKINTNLVSNILDYDLNKYLDEKILLSSKSSFSITFGKKFKIKNYKLKSKINIEEINLNLKNFNIKNYIKNFNDRIILKNGELNFNINSSNKIEAKIKSKYALSEKQKLKDISLVYSKVNSIEKYNLNIDLTENDLSFDEINFYKKIDEEFFLNLNAIKSKNIYEIKKLILFNDKNVFNLNNFKFDENFKIIDFSSIDFEYFNNNQFLSDISIKKKNSNIKLISNNFDFSKNIETSLKSSTKNNFLNIFQNLNCSLNIDIKNGKLDYDHDLKNINGEILIKKNKIDKAKISAKFINGQNFTYTKKDHNGKKVTTIYSDIAKPFVKKFKFIKGFEDGKLDYTSSELNKEISNSELRIYDFKLHDMPALTKLLSLASLQGIADLATGEGIRFNEFEMLFENSKDLIQIREIYALGPAISILMEGYVEKNNLVSLRGTLVPATTINNTISKIPLLGEILVGDKMGEGVFGVSFKIKGPPNNLETRVNPIKTLTPRFITRTLDKIKNSN